MQRRDSAAKRLQTMVDIQSGRGPDRARLPLLPLLPALVALLLPLLLAIPTEARTWRVAKDGSGDFSVIQAAADAAAPGDTIFIAAGRYKEFQITTALGLPEREACVVVSVDNLTFIGESPETVIVGPESYRYWNYGPVGIARQTALASFTRIERIGFVNNYDHIVLTAGSGEVRGCRASGSGYGVGLYDWQGGVVEDCHFQDVINGIGLTRCQGTVVRNCRLVNASTTGNQSIIAMSSADISVSHCVLDSGFVEICFYWATGVVRNCRTGPNEHYGILIFGRGTDVLVEDCIATDATAALRVDALAVVRGNRNLFSGGTSATLYLSQANVTLRDCHILNGGAWSVKLGDDIRYSPGTYDLTGNWWGTTDSAQIDAWIYDANDNPQVGAVVRYVPFFDHPVATQEKTLGGIKGMFR